LFAFRLGFTIVLDGEDSLTGFGRKRGDTMELANQQDFLACLDRYSERNALEVFAHSKAHLLIVVKEIGFDDFLGHDYMVIGRLAEALQRRDSENALWGLAFIDLWYCSNFGGRHWGELVARDPTNSRYAIQAAYWVFWQSGADGGQALAAILNRCGCWNVAERYIPEQAGDWQWAWWKKYVLPWRECGSHS
jgi:hypothetical protein